MLPLKQATVEYTSYFIKSFPQRIMMLIHELSKQTDTPIHTIRFYEKYGLFKGKKNGAVKSNNYTWYDTESIEKLQLIKEAKEIGFTLSEIKDLIDAWYHKRLSKDKKKEALRKKILEIEEKIRQLKDVKKLLLQGIVEIDNDEC